MPKRAADSSAAVEGPTAWCDEDQRIIVGNAEGFLFNLILHAQVDATPQASLSGNTYTLGYGLLGNVQLRCIGCCGQ